MTATLAPQRVRYELKFRQITVVKKEHVYPNFIHITFTGDDLQGFESQGFDDHVKLLLPDPETHQITQPIVTEDGIQWPDNKKPLGRDFTPLTYDATTNQLVIAFAIHAGGPAIEWALKAKEGDPLAIGGPRGSFIVPKEYDWHVLIGDETAFPAIVRRIHELPASAKIFAILETESEKTQIPFDRLGKTDLHITWAYKDKATNTDMPLLSAVKSVDFPTTGTGYIWAACEAESAKEIRDYVKSTNIVPPKNMRISAYWKKGIADAHDTLET